MLDLIPAAGTIGVGKVTAQEFKALASRRTARHVSRAIAASNAPGPRVRLFPSWLFWHFEDIVVGSATRRSASAICGPQRAVDPPRPPPLLQSHFDSCRRTRRERIAFIAPTRGERTNSSDAGGRGCQVYVAKNAAQEADWSGSKVHQRTVAVRVLRRKRVARLAYAGKPAHEAHALYGRLTKLPRSLPEPAGASICCRSRRSRTAHVLRARSCRNSHARHRWRGNWRPVEMTRIGAWTRKRRNILVYEDGHEGSSANGQQLGLRLPKAAGECDGTETRRRGYVTLRADLRVGSLRSNLTASKTLSPR